MKKYILSYKNDKKFLLKEISDSIDESALCDGDTVVVCKQCNAIMHESNWNKNGDLCGICEGRELKEINRKFIESYDNIITINQIENDEKSPKDDKTKSKSQGTKNKHSGGNTIKAILIIMIIIATISGIAYASSNYHPSDFVSSYDNNNIDEADTTQEYVDDYEEITIPTVKELSISKTNKNELVIDAAFVGNDIRIDESTPKSYSGYISESASNNEYSFTTPRSGRYNFSLEDMMATSCARLRVYDEYDSCIIDTYSGTAYEDLDGKKTYRIVVSHDSGESSFNLVIGIQKKTTDISNSSTIYDQVSFENQKNKYTFTPSVTGRYRFDITETNANNSFRMMLWDDKDSNLKDTYSGGFYEVLEGGKTYDLQIRQDSGLGSYCLKIGFQKPTTDITGYTSVVDSIEYTDQKNVYMFTPSVSGRYRLDITETNANNDYRLMVWDHLENTLADTYSSGTYLNLDKGETYEIQIRHDNGFGGYTINIGYQKEKKDISDYEIIHDNIEFEDQINKYKFVASCSKEYNFDLTNYDADCSLRMIVIDEYENTLADTYSDNATVNLESGKEYTIKVIQDSGYSNYDLNIG